MTVASWKKKSSLKLRARSKDFLLIDQALMKYNAAKNAGAGERLDLLSQLEGQVLSWARAKQTAKGLNKKGQLKSKRMDAVKYLLGRIRGERTALRALTTGAEVNSAAAVGPVAEGIFKRSVRTVQGILSLKREAASAPKLNVWSPSRRRRES